MEDEEQDLKKSQRIPKSPLNHIHTATVKRILITLSLINLFVLCVFLYELFVEADRVTKTWIDYNMQRQNFEEIENRDYLAPNKV